MKFWAAIATFFATLWAAVKVTGAFRKAERLKNAQDALQGVSDGVKGANKAKKDLRDGKTPDQVVRDNDGSWD